MGLRFAALWLGLAALSWLGGCTTSDAFACNADEQCVSDGEAGRCEAEGVCSFPDTACPSGHRYGLLAGELAGECVGAGSSDGTTDVGATSISTLEPMETADGSSGPSATSTSTTTSEPGYTSEPGSMTSTSSPTSMTSMTSDTTEPETTGNGGLDPYGPCADDADCPVEGSTCIPFNNSACAPPCSEDEPCVYEGSGGSGLGCFPVGAGDGCVFLCNGGRCPEGMVCEQVKGVSYCGWEPGSGP